MHLQEKANSQPAFPSNGHLNSQQLCGALRQRKGMPDVNALRPSRNRCMRPVKMAFGSWYAKFQCRGHHDELKASEGLGLFVPHECVVEVVGPVGSRVHLQLPKSNGNYGRLVLMKSYHIDRRHPIVVRPQFSSGLRHLL